MSLTRFIFRHFEKAFRLAAKGFLPFANRALLNVDYGMHEHPEPYFEIVITDRNHLWYEKSNWMKQHHDVADCTNWALWQLGLSDIVFLVPQHVAVLYYLTYGSTSNGRQCT